VPAKKAPAKKAAPSPEFAETFAALRAILTPYAKKMLVPFDEPTRYWISSPTQTDRSGNPLMAAAVMMGKAYVSFHLLPLYMNPKLLREVPPSLKKRLHGKACFNFKTVEKDLLKELAVVTKKGIADLKNAKLPWE
jgi:hypothetical protein